MSDSTHAWQQIRPRPHRDAFHRAPAVVSRPRGCTAHRRQCVGDEWRVLTLQITERLLLNVDAVAGQTGLWRRSRYRSAACGKARNGGTEILKNQIATTRARRRSPSRNPPWFSACRFLYMKSAKASNAAGAELNCNSSGAFGSIILITASTPALLRLVLVVDLCRFFRVVRA